MESHFRCVSFLHPTSAIESVFVLCIWGCLLHTIIMILLCKWDKKNVQQKHNFIAHYAMKLQHNITTKSQIYNIIKSWFHCETNSITQRNRGSAKLSKNSKIKSQFHCTNYKMELWFRCIDKKKYRAQERALWGEGSDRERGKEWKNEKRERRNKGRKEERVVGKSECP